MYKIKDQSGQSFFKGALILTISMFTVKIIGALFKIPLMRIIGGVGTGYFNSAYELYNPLAALATAGFPIAISKLVAENIATNRFRDVRRIHKISIPIFILTGTIGFIFMLISAPIYASLIGSKEILYPTLALAPTVLFICMMSIYRGYYEGMRNMVPTAISEIVEALSKLIIGLSACYLVFHIAINEINNKGSLFGVSYKTIEAAKNKALSFSAAAAITGITLGAAFAFIFLFLRHKKTGDGITSENLLNSPKPMSKIKTIKSLIAIAVPVGLGTLVMNISGLIDSTIIIRRLNYIMETSPQILLNIYGSNIKPEVVNSGSTSMYLYGCFGYGSEIIMILPGLTQVFGISALPSVTAAWAKGEKKFLKKSIESVLRLTTLITIPAGIGLSILGGPILRLIYGYRPEVNIASNIITIMGIAVIFTSTSTPICSMLQAIGRADLPVKLLSVGVLIKIILNYILVGIPEINIQGAGTGTLFCYLFVVSVALYQLCKATKIIPNWVDIFIKPLVASITCCISGILVNTILIKWVNPELSIIFAVVFSIIIYFIILLLIRGIRKSDIKLLPKGKKIVKILEKYKWMR